MLTEPVIEPSRPKIEPQPETVLPLPVAQPETVLLVPVEEVARLFSLSRSTVYDLITRGALESVKIGRSRRITWQAINRYVASLEGSDR